MSGQEASSSQWFVEQINILHERINRLEGKQQIPNCIRCGKYADPWTSRINLEEDGRLGGLICIPCCEKEPKVKTGG